MLPEFVNCGGEGFRQGSRYKKQKRIIHHSLALLSQSGKALAIPMERVRRFNIKRTHYTRFEKHGLNLISRKVDVVVIVHILPQDFFQ